MAFVGDNCFVNKTFSSHFVNPLIRCASQNENSANELRIRNKKSLYNTLQVVHNLALVLPAIKRLAILQELTHINGIGLVETR